MRIGLFTYSRTLLLITLLLAAVSPGFAAYFAPMAIDKSFGTGGSTVIPTYDGTYTITAPIGFVRLPLSGGYIVFTRQNKAGTERLVAVRFTDAGTVNTSWGTGGKAVYAVPAPLGTDAQVVVGVEGGVERIYVAGRFSSGITYLMLATFGADGAFLNFSSSQMQNAFQNYGVGEVHAMVAGASTNGQGVLIAAKGAGVASSIVAIIGADFTNGTPGNLQTLSYTFSRPNLRINRLVDRGDGKTDVLGTESNQAIYMRFAPHDFHTGTTGYVEVDRFFSLPCDTGNPSSSSADGILRPAAFGSDVLLLGRVSCTSGDYSVASRISSIESAVSILWGTRLDPGLNSNLGCAPPFSGSACMSANMTYAPGSDANEIFITNGFPGIAHLNLGSAPGVLRGTDYNTGAPLILPSYRYGSYLQYPYLTGIGDTGFGQLAIVRTAVDRLFADGVEGGP